MRLCLPLLLVCSAWAQVCAPGRISPAGVISGALDDTSCFLSDSTAYTSYRLDLPLRGSIRITLATAENFDLILRDSTGAKIGGGASIRRPLEAGSYTLLVNARLPGQVGAFTLRTDFIPETGILCRNFPAIGLSQKLDATLGVAGCAAPDGSPYDAYVLNTFGAGTLTVTVSADWSPATFIRTPDGAAIASGDSTLTTVLDRDTAYRIVVATNDRSGSYRIATSFTPAETETCRPMKRLAASDTDFAAIGADSCAMTQPHSGDLIYYNYYAVKVDTAGLADFIAASSDFSATLELFDDTGALLAADSGGADGGGAQIRAYLRPGDYLARVFSSTLEGGAYRFSYNQTPGAPSPCPAASLDLSAPATASLAAASCRTRLGLSDLYNLTLPAAGTLDLNLARISSLNPVLAVRDRKDNLILLTRDVQDLGMAQLTADLPAGDYTVVAAAGAGAGFYQLTASFTARDLPACPAPQTIAIDAGWVQRLSPYSCRGPNGAPVDYYEFTLPAEATTALLMTSNDIDSHLTLSDAAAAELRSDDNTYGSGSAIMVQQLPAGTYRLAARAASGSAGGLYRVDVRNAPGPRPRFCAPKAAIPIGESVTGTIDFAGCQYVDDTFADLYKIKLTESATLDIRLTSADFDAYLELLDAKGNRLDRDDDGAGNQDARLVPSLLPGTYFIVAKPVEFYTAGGAYSLSVSK